MNVNYQSRLIMYHGKGISMRYPLFRVILFGVVCSLLLSFSPSPIYAQNYALTVYNDAEFSGTWCYSNEPLTANIHYTCNDQISSIRLQSGWSVLVFRDQNQGGPAVCLNQTDGNLTDNTFNDGSSLNDSISSFILYNQAWCGGKTIPSYPLQVFNDSNFLGGMCWSTDEITANIHYTCDNLISSTLLREGWSIRVFNGQNQQGSNACLAGSDYDLSDNVFDDGNAMNDAISSFVLYRQPSCGQNQNPPAEPTNPIATNVTDTSVSMLWVDRSDNEDGFKIYRWDNPDVGWFVVGQVGVGVTSFTATGLACATSYYFNVNAFNAFGETPAPSDGWLFVTTADCPVQTYTVSGYIRTSSGTGIANVQISDGIQSTTTDSNGQYILQGVSSGTYTLTPSHNDYTFSPSSHSITVSGNLSGQDFTATAITGLNLTVTNIELSQAIQTLNNSVPLVANRPAIVRVYVGMQNSNTNVTGVTARLHAMRNGVELPGSPLDPFNSDRIIIARLAPDREMFDQTLNFQLPAVWLTAGSITFWAEVNPGRTIIERNYSDNRSPNYDFAFQSVPDLTVVLVPVAYQRNGQGQIYRPSLNSSNNYGLGMLLKTYPIANVRYEIHSEYLFRGDLKTDTGWYTLLQEIDQLRSRERPNERFLPKYYGVLPMEASFWGGLGYRPGNASIGLVNQEDVAAHEIGHNLGLRHVDCGKPSGPDPTYPYPLGVIGNVGIDVYSQQLIPASTKDLMSYCWPKWISDYYYTKLYNALVQQQAQSLLANTIVEDGLLVSGRINSDGITGFLNYAEPISSTNIVSTPGQGLYRLELRDAANLLIFSYAFDPNAIYSEDDIPQPADFSFIVPNLPKVGSITVWKDDTLVATLTSSLTSPSISASQVAGSDSDPNIIVITWQISNPGGQNPLTNLRYSPDNGQTWQVLALGLTDTSFDLDTRLLAASANGIIEVVANNGADIEVERLNLGTIANKSPVVDILGERTVSIGSTDPLVLSGIATDIEDGAFEPNQLRWLSTTLGDLGTGNILILPSGLPLGLHTITLTATDSAGATSQSSMNVEVSDNLRVFLPLLR